MPVRESRLAWGKFRRWFRIAFHPAKTERDLERRRGQCNRCGVSCKILFQCPAYDDSDGSPKCLVYNDRPGVCGLFPLNEKDIEDRNLMSPRNRCGYTFVKERTPIAEEDKEQLNGKRFSLRGSVNIVRYFVIGLGKPPSNGQNGH